MASVDSTLAQPDAYVRASLDQGLPVGGPWLSFSKATLRAEALRPLPGGLTAWTSIRGTIQDAAELSGFAGTSIGALGGVLAYRHGPGSASPALPSGLRL